MSLLPLLASLLSPNIPEYELANREGGWQLANLLKETNLSPSTSEAFRLIKQGGVKIDGNKITDRDYPVETEVEHIYQVGKRKFARVVIKQ